MNDSERDARAQLLLLFVMVIWAANYPLAKYSFGQIDKFVFNAVRYIIAAGLLAGIYFFGTKRVPLPEGGWQAILRAGVIANVLYQIAFVIGLSMTTAGNAAVLLSTSPLWTVFLNAYLHKEKIRPAIWVGMAISLCGVVLIILGSGKTFEFGQRLPTGRVIDDSSSGQALFGDLICLAAAVLWAFSTNLQKPLLLRNTPLYVAMIMVSVGAVGLSAAAIPAAVLMDWSSVGWTYWAATVASGALSIGISNVLWSHGVQRLGPGRTANFNNLVPVLALLISYVTLREDLHVLQFVGAAITIGGVWLARR